MALREKLMLEKLKEADERFVEVETALSDQMYIATGNCLLALQRSIRRFYR